MGLRAVSHHWCCRSPPDPAGTASWAGREVCGTRSNQCGQPYCFSVPETTSVPWWSGLGNKSEVIVAKGVITRSPFLQEQVFGFYTLQALLHMQATAWSKSGVAFVLIIGLLMQILICAHMGCATLLSTPGTWYKCPPLTQVGSCWEHLPPAHLSKGSFCSSCLP